MNDGCLSKLLAELVVLAERWNEEKDTSVKLIGRDIKATDINAFARVMQFNDLRALSTNDEKFACRRCPSFLEHVSAFFTSSSCELLFQPIEMLGRRDYESAILVEHLLNLIYDATICL